MSCNYMGTNKGKMLIGCLVYWEASVTIDINSTGLLLYFAMFLILVDGCI